MAAGRVGATATAILFGRATLSETARWLIRLTKATSAELTKIEEAFRTRMWRGIPQ